MKISPQEKTLPTGGPKLEGKGAPFSPGFRLGCSGRTEARKSSHSKGRNNRWKLFATPVRYNEIKEEKK